jgi:hypothetical protein
LSRSQLDAAEDSLKTALGINSMDTDALFLSAELYGQRGQHTLSQAYLERCLDSEFLPVTTIQAIVRLAARHGYGAQLTAACRALGEEERPAECEIAR